MAKHIPERMCACCRSTYPKSELIRVVKSGDEFFVDETFKAAGRGAYVCKKPECLARLLKTRALNKSFKAPVPDEVYDAVLQAAKKDGEANGQNAE